MARNKAKRGGIDARRPQLPLSMMAQARSQWSQERGSNAKLGTIRFSGAAHISKAGSGYARNKFNFLLKRDINPAANDHSPMWEGSTA